MAYGESNGHVTDDVTWPWKVIVFSHESDPKAQYLENGWREARCHKDHQKEMAYEESNGHVTDDVIVAHAYKGQFLETARYAI